MGWLGSHERPVKVPAGGLQKNWTAVPTRAVIEDLKNKGDIDFVWHLGDSKRYSPTVDPQSAFLSPLALAVSLVVGPERLRSSFHIG